MIHVSIFLRLRQIMSHFACFSAGLFCKTRSAPAVPKQRAVQQVQVGVWKVDVLQMNGMIC